MPQISKPNTLNKIWASGGDRATPLDSKISSGWQIEIPPRQWFNWLDNRQDQAIAHFNQHGIPVWDDQTEYQAGKSYVQDPGNGLVYRCVITHTGRQPALTPSHWTVAFADAATAFSESQADAKYLAKSSNFADVPNKAAARTNLDVYSRSEVNGMAPRGFISFNGATGSVIASKNLSLVKLGAGRYRIMIDTAAQRGNGNYCVVVGAIDTGVTSQAYSLAAGAHNSTTASVATRTNTYFEVNCVLRESRPRFAGGNDNNDAQALAINLADHAYISLAFFW